MRLMRWISAFALLGTGLVAFPARAEYQSFRAVLDANNQVDPAGNPQPGPTGGKGSALIEIDLMKRELCHTLDWSDAVSQTGEPNAAHIHQGDAGKVGPIVVILDDAGKVPKNKRTCSFQEVASGTLEAIVKNPSGHYVNIHNTQYVNGAIRGQLQSS